MNIIFFDMCGTLIVDNNSDHDKALQWLAHEYFDNRVEELRILSDLFKTEYIKLRKDTSEEIAFTEQLIFFEKELNIKTSDNYSDIEYNFMLVFRKEKLVDGAVELLKFLKYKGYEIYIITNSIFSGDNIYNYLSRFDISQYIAKVYSSADIGFRKPAKQVFNQVLMDLKIVDTQNIYYIGDSFEKDYKGSKNSGMIPILITKDQSIKGLTFENLDLVLEYFKCIKRRKDAVISL